MIFPAATTAGGQCMAFPDVCKTPAPPSPSPVPIPYPNIAMLNQATKTSTKVKFDGKPAVTKKSEVPQSQGDEAGTLFGVKSNKNMGTCIFQRYSSKVKAEGQNCVYLTCTTGQNSMGQNFNAVGTLVACANMKVKVTP